MAVVTSIDPRSGTVVEIVAEETTSEELDALCRRAAQVAPALDALGGQGRAAMLAAMANELEGDSEAIVALADRETALGTGRLSGELRRVCFQLRMFAEVLEEGSYLEATIDHAGDTAMGPRPDLRRMLIPIGPVAVFGASNFPLAFSVPGGDTASALAAGCPVVVKAHPAHPATSERCLSALVRGAESAGAPTGTVAAVQGVQAGAALVGHPAIRAVGFTGSLAGGRALFDLASSRPDPIPFYGELSSLNPVVATGAAAAERGAAIGKGFVESFTLGVGQFCTKPGLIFIPSGAAGAPLLSAIEEAAGSLADGVMLTGGIRDAFLSGSDRLASLSGVSYLKEPSKHNDGGGFAVEPRIFKVSAPALADEANRRLIEECFGPVSIVVNYDDAGQLIEALGRLEGSLTATVQAGTGEVDLPSRIVDAMRSKVGRVIFDGFPTGVAVAWAMHHGGPYPSSTSELHTSVGASAIRRFLRPVCYQNAPDALLPEALRERGTLFVPRRIDGVLHLASLAGQRRLPPSMPRLSPRTTNRGLKRTGPIGG